MREGLMVSSGLIWLSDDFDLTLFLTSPGLLAGGHSTELQGSDHLLQQGEFPLPLRQPPPQAGHRRGDVAGKIGFLFHPGEVAEGPQDLEVAAQGQVAVLTGEGLPVHPGQPLLEQVQVMAQQLFLPGRAQIHVGIDEEGGHVVTQRPQTPALEIDDPQAPVLDHQVAGLEVPVQEEVGSRNQGPGEEPLKVRGQLVDLHLQSQITLQKSPDEIT